MINSDDTAEDRVMLRGQGCEEVGPDGETCIFGRKHAAGHHLTPDGERWVSASTLNLRLRPGRIAPTLGDRPERDPLRSIAEALWNVGEGYTVEDIGAIGNSSQWSPDNADDVADEALHMGHAARVLEHLVAAGWTPPAGATQGRATASVDDDAPRGDVVTTLQISDSVKMIRETLCAAQGAVNRSIPISDRRDEHSARLQRLIDECDRQRPLGPDGKHGDRHTPTCGCDRLNDDARRWVADNLIDAAGMSFWAEQGLATGVGNAGAVRLGLIASGHLRKYNRLASRSVLETLSVYPDRCVCPVPGEAAHGVPCSVHPDDNLRRQGLRHNLSRLAQLGLLTHEHVDRIVAEAVPDKPRGAS